MKQSRNTLKSNTFVYTTDLNNIFDVCNIYVTLEKQELSGGHRGI